MKINIILVVFFTDILIITLHLFFYQTHTIFNLDMENNLPTAYQGLKLFFVASNFLLFFYLIKDKVKSRLKKILPFLLALSFLVLSIDELAQLHENSEIYLKELFPQATYSITSAIYMSGYTSTLWLVIYLPAFIFVITIFMLFVKLFKYLKSVWAFWAGVFCFLSVPLVELVNTSERFFFQENYAYLVLLEESLEIFGASFFLLFTDKLLRRKLLNIRKVSS